MKGLPFCNDFGEVHYNNCRGEPPDPNFLPRIQRSARASRASLGLEANSSKHNGVVIETPNGSTCVCVRVYKREGNYDFCRVPLSTLSTSDIWRSLPRDLGILDLGSWRLVTTRHYGASCLHPCTYVIKRYSYPHTTMAPRPWLRHKKVSWPGPRTRPGLPNGRSLQCKRPTRKDLESTVRWV